MRLKMPHYELLLLINFVMRACTSYHIANLSFPLRLQSLRVVDEIGSDSVLRVGVSLEGLSLFAAPIVLSRLGLEEVSTLLSLPRPRSTWGLVAAFVIASPDERSLLSNASSDLVFFDLSLSTGFLPSFRRNSLVADRASDIVILDSGFRLVADTVKLVSGSDFGFRFIAGNADSDDRSFCRRLDLLSDADFEIEEFEVFFEIEVDSDPFFVFESDVMLPTLGTISATNDAPWESLDAPRESNDNLLSELDLRATTSRFCDLLLLLTLLFAPIITGSAFA